jgi:hypothetical protein
MNEMKVASSESVVRCFLSLSLVVHSKVFARSFGCLKLPPRAWRDSDIPTKQKGELGARSSTGTVKIASEGDGRR